MQLEGKTVIVTGGASGIGRALAIEFIERGASVAVADQDAEGLEATAALAKERARSNNRVSTHILDVSKLDQWQAFKKSVITEYQHIDGIVNNAGVALSATVEDLTYDQLDWMMGINFNGMVYGSKEFLPLLQKRPEAFIANVSSVFGLFPVLRQSAYCASKFAIRGFTQSLQLELRDTNISVSSIHPGHIGTNIALNAPDSETRIRQGLSAEEVQEIAQNFKESGLDPAIAANIIVNGVVKKKKRILVGGDAVVADFLTRMFPTALVNWINARIEKTFGVAD